MKIDIPSGYMNCFRFVNHDFWLIIDHSSHQKQNQQATLYLTSDKEFKNTLIKQLIHTDDVSKFVNTLQRFNSLKQELSDNHTDVVSPCITLKIKNRCNKLININVSGLNTILPFGKDNINFFTELPCSVSEREAEVLRLLSNGDSSKMIAEKLSICESTVFTHRKNLLNKFEAKNTADLVRLAFKSNFI